jgi:hypothetical protein
MMGAWMVLYTDGTVRVVGRSEAEAAARELRRSRSGEVITNVAAVATIVEDEEAA